MEYLVLQNLNMLNILTTVLCIYYHTVQAFLNQTHNAILTAGASFKTYQIVVTKGLYTSGIHIVDVVHGSDDYFGSP